MDFEKFDEMVDLDGLKADIAAASNGGSGAERKDVPHGTYEVEIEKLELTTTKTSGKPMITCWFRVLSEGEYLGQMIFMNQVVSQGFQIHLVNEFLRSIADAPDAPTITFESYSQYAQLIMDVAEYIDGKFEYALHYGQTPKGYDTFEIEEIFELE